MIKRLLIALLAGISMMVLWLRPFSIEEGVGALLPSHFFQEGFGQYPSMERRDQIFIVLKSNQGDILNTEYLKILKRTTNDIFFLPGVDRIRVASLYNVNVAFRDVVNDGFEGGPVIAEDNAYDERGIEDIRRNLNKSPYMGQLVAYDFKSTVIVVPMLGNTNGRMFLRQVEEVLKRNAPLEYVVLGYVPYMVALHDAMVQTVQVLAMAFLGAWGLFCLIRRRFLVAVALAPLMSLVLTLLLYRCFSPSLHPLLLPLLVVVMMMGFADRAWLELNEGKVPWRDRLAAIGMIWGVGCLYCLDSGIGQAMAVLALCGSIALCAVQYLLSSPLAYSHNNREFQYGDGLVGFTRGLGRWLAWAVLAVGLASLWGIVVGRAGLGPALLGDNVPYQRSVASVNHHFAFTADSMIVAAFATGKGCADPSTVQALEQFHWFLTGFPGVRTVASLDEAVKRINMFVHENNPKWRAIPRDPAILKFVTGQLDPKTGLLDDAGLVFPITVYFENHDPHVINAVYQGIQQFKRTAAGISLKIVGGSAALEAMRNIHVATTVPWVMAVLVAGIFLLMVLSGGMRAAVIGTFFLCVLLAVGFTCMDVLGWGLNSDTVHGCVLGAVLCLFLYRLCGRSQRAVHVQTLIWVCALPIVAGALSGVLFCSNVFIVALVMLCMVWLGVILSRQPTSPAVPYEAM